MNILESILLAILQGITEFLPVSSSGHLIIAQELLGAPAGDLTFEIVLHMGTLLAVLIYFRGEIGDLMYGMSEEISRSRYGKHLRFLVLIGLANIPAAIVGLFLKDVIEQMFLYPPITCFLLLVTGGFLLLDRYADDEYRYTLYTISLQSALLIGLFQAFAVLPGVSRAGVTISIAILLSVRRSDAGTFSFLLSIPAITGAFVIDTVELSQTEQMSTLISPVYLTGFVVATLTGWGALHLLMPLLQKRRFYVFAYYLFPVGLIGIPAFLFL